MEGTVSEEEKEWASLRIINGRKRNIFYLHDHLWQGTATTKTMATMTSRSWVRRSSTDLVDMLFALFISFESLWIFTFFSITSKNNNLCCLHAVADYSYVLWLSEQHFCDQLSVSVIPPRFRLRLHHVQSYSFEWPSLLSWKDSRSKLFCAFWCSQRTSNWTLKQYFPCHSVRVDWSNIRQKSGWLSFITGCGQPQWRWVEKCECLCLCA